MEVDSRDSRRKRIMERGSDRLAFITGEAKSLPIPSSPPPPRTPAKSLPIPSSPPPPRTPPNLEVTSFGQADVIAEHDDETGLSPVYETSPRDESAEDEFRDESAEDEFPKCKLGKEFPKPGRSNEATIDAHPTVEGMEVSDTSAARGSSSDQVVGAAPFTTLTNPHIFTPNAINRSIAATEDIRILCAIAIALLVVLSSHGYSLGGRILNSLVSFRPLFLLLLTDVTIVLGWVMSNEESDRREGEARTGQEETSLANVGNALEVGLLLQKASRAAFMDFSICAVIMICGIAV